MKAFHDMMVSDDGMRSGMLGQSNGYKIAFPDTVPV